MIVRYEAANAMLLNEFLKEHAQVQRGLTNRCSQRRPSICHVSYHDNIYSIVRRG